MSKSAENFSPHSQAYAPRSLSVRSFTFGWLLPGLIVALIVWTVARTSQLLALAIGLFVAVALIRSIIRLWTAKPPVVVDELGITFSKTGGNTVSNAGEGPRLVPWKSITEVVLFETPRTDTYSRRWQPAIGAGLVGYPDGASVYRPLAGWSLNRIALERAVTRFGGGVKVVDGARVSAEPTTEQTRAEMHRIAVETINQAGVQASTPGGPPKRLRVDMNRTARYRPSDPAAYLARLDLRSNLGLIGFLLLAQVVLWVFFVPRMGAGAVGAAAIFALPLLLIWRSLRAGGAVALAVDRPGIFFGQSGSPGDEPVSRLVAWADITAVVVYDQLLYDPQQSQWRRAVGVRLRGEQTLVGHWRIIDGWRLDRQALEAAVSRFAAGTPVLDGPPQRPPTSVAARQALFDPSRNAYGDQDRRREG